MRRETVPARRPGHRNDRPRPAPSHIRASALVTAQLLAQGAPRGLRADACMRLKWRSAYGDATAGERARDSHFEVSA